jgi:hypothetical protein
MLLLLALMAQATRLAGGQPQVPFESGKIEPFRQKAAEANKPYLIYFYTKKDAGTRRMDKQTWADPELAAFIGSVYLALSCDVLSPSTSPELIQEQRIYTYPTLLIYSPEGRLMGRTEGFVAPSTLLQILQRHQRQVQSRQQAQILALRQALKPTPALAAQVRSRHSPEASSLQIADIAADPSQRVVGRSQAPSSRHLDAPGYEPYSPSRLSSSEPVLGILVAAHAQPSRFAQDFDRIRRFWKGEIWAFCEDIEGALIYKIALGAYETREEAELYAQAIAKFQRMEGVILDLGTLR